MFNNDTIKILSYQSTHKIVDWVLLLQNAKAVLALFA